MFPVLLLFFLEITYCLIAQETEIKFHLKLLEDDLEAISLYYIRTNSSLNSYIHWPNSITFPITKTVEEDVEYLKIDGRFTSKIPVIHVEKGYYDGLYYLNEIFYVKTDCGSMTDIRSNKALYYKQAEGITSITESYLSIRYLSLEEIKQSAETFYAGNQHHVDTVMRSHPATFLATSPYADKAFIEYTFWSDTKIQPSADGYLKVLIANEKNNKLKVTGTRAYKLVFDQRDHIFTVPQKNRLNAQPFENVFGVRMASVGYIEEKHGSEIRILSDDDFYPVYRRPDYPSPVNGTALLEKIKIVEPRSSYPGLDYSTLNLPERVLFQFMGKIFVKSVNFLNKNEINQNCPFVITHKNEPDTFQFHGHSVSKLCTDDIELWAEREGK